MRGRRRYYSPQQIMRGWVPGSGLDWKDEVLDLLGRSEAELLPIAQRMKVEGFWWDGSDEPVLLGSDGRVWDGHHRILVAALFNLPSIPVEVVDDAT